MAFAQSATDQIINDLTNQGFQRIEIDNGIGQIKVEAIRGTQKLEVVYDRATGSILKQEVERVRAGEDTRPGVEIRNRDRNFVDVGRVSDDSRTATSTSTRSSTSVATGSTSTDQLVSDLQAQGYTRIEVKNGVTQTKVEAVRGTEKIETVFDRATGEVIKQEVETVRSGDDTRPGVEIDTRDRDFVGGGRSDDDEDDDRRSGRDDDSSDDDRNDDRGGRGSDDDGSDDRGGRGSDDDGSDDRGGRDDDDGRDDDRGGRDDDNGRDDDRGDDDSDDDNDDDD